MSAESRLEADVLEDGRVWLRPVGHDYKPDDPGGYYIKPATWRRLATKVALALQERGL